MLVSGPTIQWGPPNTVPPADARLQQHIRKVQILAHYCHMSHTFLIRIHYCFNCNMVNSYGRIMLH